MRCVCGTSTSPKNKYLLVVSKCLPKQRDNFTNHFDRNGVECLFLPGNVIRQVFFHALRSLLIARESAPTGTTSSPSEDIWIIGPGCTTCMRYRVSRSATARRKGSPNNERPPPSTMISGLRRWTTWESQIGRAHV